MVQGRCKFSEGEKVLCFHGPLIYEAKCIKVRTRDQKHECLVHYAGWNKKWDEYVPETRILKHNEANLQKQKSLKEAHTANVRAKKQGRATSAAAAAAASSSCSTTSAAGAVAATTPEWRRRSRVDVSPASSVASGGGGGGAAGAAADETTSSTSARKRRLDTTQDAAATDTTTVSKKTDPKKRLDSTENNSSDSETASSKAVRHDVTVETEEQFMTKVEVRIKLPEELKLWLVDDWDFVIRQRKLYQLPARVTCAQCIAEYIKYKSNAKIAASKLSAMREVAEGLREYFNVMLGTQLLYKFERTQYADLLGEHKHTLVCDLYGPIHIVRLLVKLGPMLSYTELDEKSVNILQQHIQDFLRFMVRNAERFFSAEDYYVAPAEYHRRSL